DLPYLTNKTVLQLDRLPRRLLMLGGGAVGLELAQAFRRLGSEVSVVEQLDRLLPREEPEAGELLARALQEEGFALRLGAKVVATHAMGSEIVLPPSDGTLGGDALLVAAGRRGALEGLGLDALSLEPENGYLTVDGRCRTGVRHVFAAGDVTGG